MARKAPGTAVAKRGNTTPANIREQLSQEAANIQNQINAVGGSKIKTTDKTFTFPDGTVDTGPIQLVILDFRSRNTLYEGKWDPKNPQPPSCFSIGTVIRDMEPSANSPEPQADDCSSCPMNQFGSDGDGKACKNTRLLAVMPPDATEEDEIYTLEVSPTALKRFDSYVATLSKMHGLPPVAFTTEVGFHPETTYSSLTFGNAEPLDDKELAVMMAKRTEARTILEAEPNLDGVEKKAPKKKAPARRRRR